MRLGVAGTIGAWSLGVVAALGVARVAVALPERCDPSSPAELEAGIGEAVAWFDRNQLPDGSWRYRLDVDTGEDLGGYNWVRHAGVLLSLEQAASAGVDGAVDVAARGYPVILQRLATGEGWTALEDGPTLSTGGTALLTVALAQTRFDGAGDVVPARADGPATDELLLGLGHFLADQVLPDGGVAAAADVETGRPAGSARSPFATGQVLFALARLERLLPDQGFAPPVRAISAYLAHDRARIEGYVPDSTDHWAAYGLAEVTRWPGADADLFPDELSFVRKQLGLTGVSVRYESQRDDDSVVRWLRGRGTSGAGLGTLGEAMGGWLAITRAEPVLGDQAGWARDRLACTATVLLRRQIDAGEAASFPDPPAAAGTFPQFGIAQMDDQQHPLSALLLSSAAQADPEPLPRRTPIPEHWLLALLAALAATNPLRLVARGPTGGGSWRPIALGGALATAVLAAVAALGGPLLRSLDVSAATALVAAGVAVVMAGLLTAGWPLGREPALDGWRAALVPVAIPLVLRPELLLLALACGSGGQGMAAVVGVALAAALAVPLAGRWPDAGPSGVVATWALRAVAIATVALGVAVVVDGVYAI